MFHANEMPRKCLRVDNIKKMKDETATVQTRKS